MPGLVPGIHDLSAAQWDQDVDGRDKPGHDAEGLMRANRNWLVLLGAGLLVTIMVATLMPAGWQIRLGLHWLVEHFLAYFAVTTIFCLAWPRPMRVAAVLLPLAVLLEAAQGLTPDRTPDPATVLSAATGVSLAALLADFVLTLRQKRQKA